jgi:cytochrome c oxidase cbb3-type subunit 4
MIDYHLLREFADSWGLLFMLLTFLVLIGWTFLPGSRERHHDAANMIFDEAKSLDKERDNVQ